MDSDRSALVWDFDFFFWDKILVQSELQKIQNILWKEQQYHVFGTHKTFRIIF